MVVVGWIQWVLGQIERGRPVTLHVTHSSNAKTKVRVILGLVGGECAAPPMFFRQVLNMVSEQLKQRIAVDRGHTFSSGRSEVAIWLHQASPLTPKNDAVGRRRAVAANPPPSPPGLSLSKEEGRAHADPGGPAPRQAGALLGHRRWRRKPSGENARVQQERPHQVCTAPLALAAVQAEPCGHVASAGSSAVAAVPPAATGTTTTREREALHKLRQRDRDALDLFWDRHKGSQVAFSIAAIVAGSAGSHGSPSAVVTRIGDNFPPAGD
eukprot:TRINITY_DN7707_c0_g1_i9.p1 TRINITY_DN7707_c0_g1~~TRINITY_DN7707_c0_g1_i9.p1  ORF type:complete len:268 (+),score=34.55 TRINITY_DN7707_c0_g1_i9:106-909(+)